MARREIEALAKVPIFAELSDRNLRRILRSSETYTYEDGASVVKEGTPSRGVFVILQGKAKVVRRGRTVDRLHAGDFFGEIGLLDGGPRTASVVAEGTLTCLVVLREEFRRILADEPPVAAAVLRGAAARLRRLERSPTS